MQQYLGRVVLCFLLMQMQLVVGTTTGGCSNKISVDPTSQHLVDEHGHVRVFHGVNIVHKLPPFHPTFDGPFDINNSFVAEDFAHLKELGVNVVRLGVMWPGVEPTRDQYNQTYLSVMRDFAVRLGQQGIYTMVDFHQDLLHGAWCGEGLPNYIQTLISASSLFVDHCEDSEVGRYMHVLGLCKSFKHDYKYDVDPDTGLLNVDQCLSRVFGYYYTSPEVTSAFDIFFNSDEIKTRLALYFEQIAQTFHDVPSVIGYDLFNEPFPGDVFNKPWLLKSGAADKAYLQPLYEQLHTSIRKFDPHKILFYEPVQFPDSLPVLGGMVNPVGFTQGPGGASFSDRHALSYHIYSCAAGQDYCDEATGDVLAQFGSTCDFYSRKKYDKRMQDVRRIGGGGFLTEFGACSDTKECVDEIQRIVKHSDRYFQSWAYWQYKYQQDITTISGSKEGFFHPDQSLQRSKVEALMRPYAQVLATRNPKRMEFGVHTRVLQLAYDAEVGTTRVFLKNDWTYPQGYHTLITAGSNDAVLEHAHNELSIRHTRPEAFSMLVYPAPVTRTGETEYVTWRKDVAGTATSEICLSSAKVAAAHVSIYTSEQLLIEIDLLPDAAAPWCFVPSEPLLNEYSIRLDLETVSILLVADEGTGNLLFQKLSVQIKK